MESIHVKLEQEEAITIKREALILEQELLQAIIHLRAYNSLKKREFILKNQIKKDLLSLKNHMEAIQNDLPINELGFISKKDTSNKTIHQVIKKEKSINEKKQSDIDRELKEIHDKLALLG
jgi:hypothetical protein